MSAGLGPRYRLNAETPVAKPKPGPEFWKGVLCAGIFSVCMWIGIALFWIYVVKPLL